MDNKLIYDFFLYGPQGLLFLINKFNCILSIWLCHGPHESSLIEVRNSFHQLAYKKITISFVLTCFISYGRFRASNSRLSTGRLLVRHRLPSCKSPWWSKVIANINYLTTYFPQAMLSMLFQYFQRFLHLIIYKHNCIETEVAI